jgi:hypothetical protein
MKTLSFRAWVFAALITISSSLSHDIEWTYKNGIMVPEYSVKHQVFVQFLELNEQGKAKSEFRRSMHRNEMRSGVSGSNSACGCKWPPKSESDNGDCAPPTGIHESLNLEQTYVIRYPLTLQIVLLHSAAQCEWFSPLRIL